MFYSNPNDFMQLTAAEELFQRNWRFHKEKKIWISKTQNIKARVENHNYEEGTFHVWDVESWKKVAKDMKVEYAKLEDKSPVSHDTY
jgi:CCR4-NOT transcription complex subunit 2